MTAALPDEALTLGGEQVRRATDADDDQRTGDAERQRPDEADASPDAGDGRTASARDERPSQSRVAV